MVFSRTRERKDLTLATVDRHVTGIRNGGEVLQDSHEEIKFDTFSYHEKFHDMVNDQRSPLRVNGADHLYVTVDDGGRRGLSAKINNDVWTVVYTPKYPSFRADSFVPDLACPLPSRSLTTALADESFSKLVPQVPQEVSIPNFFWELRDIASLIPKLGKSLGETVSGGYLNYQFGWKPFIGDLKKLGQLSTTVANRLSYLRSTWGKETRISYRRKLTASEYGVDVNLSNTPEMLLVREFEAFYTCGGYLYHRLEGLDGLEGTLRGMAGALGLNNPLGVVWEAVPYSFVADWFGRTSAILARTAVQPFVGVWDLRRMSHSFNLHWKLEYIREGVQDNHQTSPTEDYFGHHIRVSRYLRTPGLPAASTWLTSTSLDPRQQMLAAALLHR